MSLPVTQTPLTKTEVDILIQLCEMASLPVKQARLVIIAIEKLKVMLVNAPNSQIEANEIASKKDGS